MNQSEFKANTCNWRQAREETCERGTIGFGFTSYWLKKWREFYQPITARSNAKPKQKCNYFRHSIENRSNLRQTTEMTTWLCLSLMSRSPFTVSQQIWVALSSMYSFFRENINVNLTFAVCRKRDFKGYSRYKEKTLSEWTRKMAWKLI